MSTDFEGAGVSDAAITFELDPRRQKLLKHSQGNYRTTKWLGLKGILKVI